MKLALYTATGRRSERTVTLPDTVFAAPVNTGLMHQALVAQMGGTRVARPNTLTRGEVHGTTAKVWRQKGTGRARHGARKVNLWRGGGVSAGPRRERNYSRRMPRKMRRSALRSALTAKAAEDRIVVLERLTVKGPKTKVMAELLEKLGAAGDALVVLPDKDENVWLSARNLAGVKTILARNLNLRDLLDHEWLVMTRATVSALEGTLAGEEG